MATGTDGIKYSPDGYSVAYCVDGFDADRFDDFLLSGCKPFKDGISDDDIEREDAYLDGVRQAIKELTVDSILDGLAIRLAVATAGDPSEGQADRTTAQGGELRSRAKTEADLYFSIHGKIERSHQLAIDHARGRHHTEVMVSESLFRLKDFLSGTEVTSDDELAELLIETWRDWLASQTLTRFESPPFETVSLEPLREILTKGVHRKTKAKKQSMEPVDKPGRYHVPGFIHEVMQLTLYTAPYPNRELAFCGALTLQATIVSRKVTFEGMTPNLYVLGLANSGSGKEHSRKVNTELLAAANMIEMLGDSFASGEAVEDALYSTPVMLFQTDEFDGVIAAMAQQQQTRFDSLKSALLKFYTSANSTYFLRRRAGEEPRSVYRPHLNMFATCTPGAFYESVSAKMATSGLLPRMLVVQAGPRGTGQRPKPIEPSQSIIERIEYWRDYGAEQGNLASINPRSAELSISPSASEILNSFRQRCDDLYSECQADHDEAGCAIWARAYEHCIKLAMLYSISDGQLEISTDAVSWASDFAEHQVATMIAAFRERPEGDFDKLCRRIMDRVLASEDGAPRSSLLKFTRVDAKTFDCAIRTLTERGELGHDLRGTGGRQKIVYIATDGG